MNLDTYFTQLTIVSSPLAMLLMVLPCTSCHDQDGHGSRCRGHLPAFFLTQSFTFQFVQATGDRRGVGNWEWLTNGQIQSADQQR